MQQGLQTTITNWLSDHGIDPKDAQARAGER